MISLFYWGLLAGLIVGVAFGIVLTAVITNFREDKFWRRAGVK